MPEKPEVITVTNNLKKQIIEKKIVGCNIYWDNIIAYPTTNEFKKEIINQKIKCPEIQLDDTEEIAKFSAKYASDKLKSNVIKVDSGLFIEAFDGFPRTIFRIC